ncbi:MAG: hypothetical protein ACYDAA_03560 [Syntrophales bacterium]
MEHTGTSGIFTISRPYNDNRITPAYPGVVQSIGTVMAVIVVVIGWAINKMFGKEVLL